MDIGKLQFISQGASQEQHLASIERLCAAGCKWVQLRLKGCSIETYMETAAAARSITQKWGSRLVVNDNLDVALAVQADGCHLGQKDMPIAQARLLVPKGFVLGGSCNNLQQIIGAEAAGADYVGIGPFRFTTTKDNLNPILGLGGIADVMLGYRKLGLHIPVLAIGGIELGDIGNLYGTGVYGVALSGALAKAKDPLTAVAEVHRLLG